MKKLTQSACCSLLALAPALAHGQIAPLPSPDTTQIAPGPGFRLPATGGNLTYALNASESVSTGFYGNGDASTSTNVSGDMAFLSQSKTHPFNAVYSGAVLAGTQGQPFSIVQNLALSQTYITRLWDFTVADAVSYLPQSPSVGLSGVAGLGDLGIAPVETGPVTGQSALSRYAPRVTNSSTASAMGRLTAKTSLNATGSMLIERFTGGSSAQGLIDSNQASGSLGVSHRVNGRSSVSGNFNLSKITYSPNVYSSAFTVEGANFEYSRQWTRSLSLDASLGPQWTSTTFASRPRTSLDLATNLDATYQSRNTSATLSYVRGTNNGFGVVPGAFSNSVNGSARRTFNRVWNGSATLNYSHGANPASLGLPDFSLNTLVAGVQVSRAISRSVSTYASYSAQHQSTSGIANQSGAFGGLYQSVAFGVTYAPRSVYFGAH